ncbi:cell division protein FtsQ/DivIB [Candidatus Pelagibacter bacterium nBUS_44]|uniref:cell division protein FtsQ/DivIB n=1 Tax=Candidatus Pelagibacter bacterium nBUS_44 TaxID=3374195 RepID=UPI003EB8A4F3
MHQRKSKKILIYFFLLFLVGSINNININNLKFQSVKNINVTGLENEDNSIISKKIKNLKLDNIYLINKKDLNTLIESNNLVEKYFIFKKYPSSLNINIDKTSFLARISKNGKIYDLGSNGKLIENKYSNNQLPFVFGNPEIIEFFNIKKIIDESEISFEEIESLYFFLSKRWDLELRNNIIIKLPNDNIKESLKLASEFLHNNEFKDIKIIDARIKNQIILND